MLEAEEMLKAEHQSSEEGVTEMIDKVRENTKADFLSM